MKEWAKGLSSDCDRRTNSENDFVGRLGDFGTGSMFEDNIEHEVYFCCFLGVIFS